MDKQNHLLLTYPSSLIAAIASIFLFAEHSLVTQRNPLHFLPVSSFTCTVMAKIICCILCCSVVTRNIQRLNVKAMKWYYIQLIMMYIYINIYINISICKTTFKNIQTSIILFWQFFTVYKCNLFLHIKIEMLHLTIPPQPHPWCDIFFRLLFGMLFSLIWQLRAPFPHWNIENIPGSTHEPRVRNHFDLTPQFSMSPQQVRIQNEYLSALERTL